MGTLARHARDRRRPCRRAHAWPISARRVFAATGADHEDAALRADAAAATAELERIFEAGPVPMGEPTFVALSQTLPRLLASAWLALAAAPGGVRPAARPSRTDAGRD